MHQFKATRQKARKERKRKNIKRNLFSSGQVRRAAMGSPDKCPLGNLSNTTGGDNNEDDDD